jgi:hypothetical protein
MSLFVRILVAVSACSTRHTSTYGGSSDVKAGISHTYSGPSVICDPVIRIPGCSGQFWANYCSVFPTKNIVIAHNYYAGKFLTIRGPVSFSGRAMELVNYYYDDDDDDDDEDDDDHHHHHHHHHHHCILFSISALRNFTLALRDDFFCTLAILRNSLRWSGLTGKPDRLPPIWPGRPRVHCICVEQLVVHSHPNSSVCCSKVKLKITVFWNMTPFWLVIYS